MDKRSVIILILFGLLISCSDLFQNGDLAQLAETSRGDIAITEPLVTPSVFQKRVVTNLTMSVKAESSFEIVSVEADLTALGGGTVNLVKNGAVWNTTLAVRSEYAGSLSIRFIVRSKTGKIVETNYSVQVQTFGTVYVSTNGSDANNGMGTNSPVRTLQKGMDLANEQGIAEILVSQGLYANIINGICLNLKSGITIKGSYSLDFGTRNIVSTPSVIDGSGGANHIIAAYSVNGSTLDGFVIRNASATSDSSYDGSGAGMLVLNSIIGLYNVIISNNLATNLGGGLFSYNSTINISNVMMMGNASVNGGGLALISCPSVSLNGSMISNNISYSYGGGLFSYQTTLIMNTNQFYNNQTVMGGGAVYMQLGQLTMDRCLFFENKSICDLPYSADGGGAINAYQTVLNIMSSRFISNQAITTNNGDLLGGGILLKYSPNASIISCYFEGNISTNNSYGVNGGGGIGVNYSSNVTVSDCTFNRNFAYAGGGILMYEYSTITINNCGFYSNEALNGPGSQFHGGGIFVRSSRATINNTTFSYNFAGSGGAIYGEGFTGNCMTAMYGGSINFSTNYGITVERSGILAISGVSFTGNYPGDTNY